MSELTTAVQTVTTDATTASTAAAKDVTTFTTAVKADAIAVESWLKAHERVIIVFLVLLAGSWFGNHWLNNRAAKDKQDAVIAAQQLDVQKTKDAQLATQVQQQAGQYQALVLQLSAQNAQLANAVSNRTVVLQQQQVADKAMPLPDLGNRWATLAGIAANDITASPSGITVTPTGALDTVAQLEQVPVLTANLKDTQTVADNRQQELDKANTLVTGLNTQVAGLNTQIVDGQKSCAAQLTSQKASARKSKRNWFVKGVIVGASALVAIVFHV